MTPSTTHTSTLLQACILTAQLHHPSFCWSDLLRGSLAQHATDQGPLLRDETIKTEQDDEIHEEKY